MGKSKKSLDVSSETIEFEYDGQTYSKSIGGGLILADLSIGEIKDQLNQIPGNVSYWNALLSQIEIEIEDAEQEFESWYANKYLEVDQSDTKGTEGKKKNRIVVDSYEEYTKHQAKIRQLKDVRGKVKSIVKGYDIQAWTLRSISNLAESEMSNIDAKGRRSLDDIS